MHRSTIDQYLQKEALILHEPELSKLIKYLFTLNKYFRSPVILSFISNYLKDFGFYKDRASILDQKSYFEILSKTYLT